MSEQNDDFVSFEKALRDLKMQSEELKKLVSEGEIRAFRDGPSMKFRREDIQTLQHGPAEPEELVFEDLDDDTGMVTEELSEEDTLLAEDDLIEEEAPARASRRSAPAGSARRPRVEIEEPAHEPMIITAAAVISAVLMVYGMMIAFSIASGTAPAGLTGFFASK